jgi:hypothetical protein
MSTGNYGINDLYWLVQLGELGDTESIEALKANAGIERPMKPQKEDGNV